MMKQYDFLKTFECDTDTKIEVWNHNVKTRFANAAELLPKLSVDEGIMKVEAAKYDVVNGQPTLVIKVS